MLQSSKGDVFNCVKCGRSHRKRECPAFNKLCNLCKGKHHFASMCNNSARKPPKFIPKFGYHSKARQVDEIQHDMSVCTDEMSIY